MKTKRILALDLGSAALKLAVAQVKESKVELLQVKLLELPPGADPAARLAGLKKLLEGVPFLKFTQTVSVVDDPFGCLRQVLVPPMPAGELSGAVRWELQRYLAVPPEETTADYELLGETESAGVKKLKLLASALPSGTIREHLSFLAQAGIQATQLIPAAAAIASWLNQGKRAIEERAVAVLSVGEKSSEFLVVEAGHLLFGRKIPVAGCDITKGMTGVLMTSQGQVGLTEPEAEMIKRSHGIPLSGSSEIISHGISQMQLLSLIRGPLERLAVELERSLGFYGETTGNAPVSELLLVGGGAHLKGLSDWLQTRLGIQVTVRDPLEGIPVSRGAAEGSVAGNLALVPVLGAALGGGAGLNLLPADVREMVRAKVRRAVLTGIVTAVVMGMILLRMGMGVYHRVLLSQIAAYQLERAAVQSDLIQARAAAAVHDRQRQEPRWEELFKELSHLPREVYLTGLTIEGRQVMLRGRVREISRPSDLVLSDSMRALGQGLLTQVRLSSSRQIEGGAKEAEFEIQCLIK